MYAVSQTSEINNLNLLISFVLVHFFVFPASNGYNSYHDKDVTSIGLIRNPPAVSKKLLPTVNIMDTIAILAGLFISITFTLLLASFIIMSRAYSYRRIRLKKLPYTSFLIVSLFQGGLIYALTVHAVNQLSISAILNSPQHLLGMVISTLFIGSVYPLTQIYQHDSDKKDGVLTISYKLGYNGTFLFSIALFLLAGYLLFLQFSTSGMTSNFLIFPIIMLPVFFFFIYWFIRVKSDKKQANYSNTMIMNLITSLCMNTFFIILILR